MVARICIVALIFLVAVLLGANYVWHNSPASQILPIRTGDDPAIVAFQAEVEQAYETKGVDFMESWADELRRDQPRIAGGGTKLFEFYNVLLSINCQCRDGTRKVHSFEDRKARLEKWLQKYPDSITANLAMAALWEYRSWQVVGGYANQQPLTQAQKQEFFDDRHLALSYIGKLKIAHDPYVAFFTMRIVEYGDSDPTEAEITRLYEDSIANWPQNYQIYFLYGQTIPWVYNDRAAGIALLHGLAATKNDPNRQVGLSFIIGSMFRGFVFDGSGVTWADVKQAYEIRRHLYGWRNIDLNVFCYLAIRADDWPTAKVCMKEINGHWDDIVWNDQNDFVWNELIVSLH